MTRLKQARMGSVLIAFSCGLLSAGQEQQPSPTELVHSLANRPFEESLSACSASRNMDPIVEAIVRGGSTALSAVEAAMSSLEHAGRRSEYFESSIGG